MNTVGIIIDGVKGYFRCPRLDTRALQEVHQGNALPQGIAHVGTANVVADTHHRFDLLFSGQGHQLGIIERKGVLYLAIDG